MQLPQAWTGVAMGVVSIGVLAVAAPAHAVEPDEVGVVAAWSVDGSAGAFTAEAILPDSAGFPAITVESTARVFRAPSGESAFLGDGTAFGAEFGSTRSHPYLTIAPAPGGGNSTTTFEFAGPQPSGWGFALGDIDADWAFIRAFGGPAQTDPLTPEELGFQGAGNYCAFSPKPSTCGAGPYTDQPIWVTAPESFDGVNYVSGTLRGNSLPGAPAAGRDTSGAYGWFMPTRAIDSLVITFGVRDGAPTAQFWLAAPAPKVVVSGVVEVDGASGGVPEGTSIAISDATGEPVLGIDDEQLTVVVEPSDGTYSIELPQEAAGYSGVVQVPEGWVAPPSFDLPGLPDDPQTLEAVAPAQVVVPAVAPIPEPVPSPVPSSDPAPSVGPDEDAAPTLPDTGWSNGTGALSAALLIAAGVWLVRHDRRVRS
ncbi:hypothetical protein [uncultured Demequina sp.]|uniref:hypothetical protein n=1 Tax=uncultured Demequina sp. TaxID=693499 RepID=UPI0025D6D6F2|nr:hypothetical protein [uncultured Demequina sp.]